MSEKVDKDHEEGAGRSGFSRRSFLQGMGLAASVASLPFNVRAGRADEVGKGGGVGPGPVQMTLKINGQAAAVEAEPRMTLLEVLREKLDLTGSKLVCDRGSCGACTVMIDGQSVNSCMLLAIDAQGKDITTIEGLVHPDGKLDRVQEGFIEHDAQQCGFCTPGFVMRAHGFLKENPKPTLEQIREGLSGNICRCGTYTHVFAAVLAAAQKEG